MNGKPVVALWLRKGRVRPTLREAITTFLWAGVAFHAVNPFSVLELNEFIADVGFERFHASYGHLGLDPSQSTIGYYLLTALPDLLGLPLMIVLAATVAFVVVRRRRRKYILLAFAALYLTGIGLWEMRAERYLLPVMPVLLVLCAWGLFAFGELIRGKFARGVRRDFVLGALVLLAAVVPVAKVWTYQRTHAMPDTRTVAKQLVRKNLPAGSAVVLAPMGINLDARHLVLQLPFNPVETERLAPFYDARWYAGFDLAVVSDYEEARYLLEPARFGEILRFYRELKERESLVAVEGALKAEPERPEMVSLKGSILLKLGRYGESERFLVMALSLNDRLLSAYVDLSEVYARRNEPGLAVATLERVRSLVAPGSPEARIIEERISALREPGEK